MAALSAFRRGVDHRSTLPVTYQDHFSVLLHRSFSFSSSFFPVYPLPATTSSSSWSVGRSTFRPLSAVSSTASLLHFQPSSFFLLFLLFFSRFHLASPSTADRLLLSSSFLLDVYHLQVSGRRSILLTKMCTEKLIISSINTRNLFLVEKIRLCIRAANSRL